MEKLKFKAEKNGETVDVFLYGIVGWEFTAKDIVSLLNGETKKINVHRKMKEAWNSERFSTFFLCFPERP